jgi:hypothetical protein
MRPLVWQVVLCATRTPALWIAIVLQVAVLSIYLAVWGDGIPLVDARPVFDQFVTAQTALLLVVLPWSAARCAVTTHRDDVTLLSALAGRPPATVVLSGCVGLALALTAVVLSGLPMAVLAHQISARPAAALFGEQFRLLGLGTFAAAVAMTAVLMSGHRILGWLLATAVTGLAVPVLPGGPVGGCALFVLAGLTAGMLAARANRRWQYLSERYLSERNPLERSRSDQHLSGRPV